MNTFQVGDIVRRNKPCARPEKYGELGVEYTVLYSDCNGIRVLPQGLLTRYDNFDLVKRRQITIPMGAVVSKTYRFESGLYWTELRQIPNDLARYWSRNDANTDWGKCWYNPGEDFKDVLSHYRNVLLWNEVAEGGDAFAKVGLEIMDAQDDNPKPASTHKCTCEWSVVYSFGCACGGV